MAKHFLGAENVADEALKLASIGRRDKRDWLVRKSAALASRGEATKIGGDSRGAIRVLLHSYETLALAIKACRSDEVGDYQRTVADLSDRIWFLTKANAVDIASAVEAMDALQRLWELGDRRYSLVKRMIVVVNMIIGKTDSPLVNKSSGQRNLAIQQVGRVERIVSERARGFPNDSRNTELATLFDDVKNHL